MTPPTLRAWLQEAPFTLALSAGFFGFFAHAGVLSVLEDERLLPTKVTGASAGALAGGIWAAGLPASALARELFSLRREEFWDPALGWGLLKGARFRTRLDAVLRVKTFDACRLPLRISVFDVRARQTLVLDSGELASAIQASCTLPGLFQPVLRGEGLYIDGGVVDRPAIAGLGEGERALLHYLPSQSPWRRLYRPAQTPAQVANRWTLASPGLPRVGPFSLQRGEQAFAAARAATQAALDR